MRYSPSQCTLIYLSHNGLRVVELTGLRCEDVVLITGSHIRCLGKGRKQRSTPLAAAVTTLREWLKAYGAQPN